MAKGTQIKVEKAALFERLGYEPHEGQWRVHRSNARYRVLACGVRWGKTTLSSYEAICALLAPCESSTGWVVAPTLELTRYVFERVRAAFLQHMPHRVVEDDQRSTRFVVKNLGGGKSEMRGRTADNPASLLGEGLDWMIVDEAAKLKEDVWSSYLAPRLVDKRGWALILSTPRGLNWFHGAFWRGQNGRDPEYESWRGPTLENPLINKETVESEGRRVDAGPFEQEYEAKFIGEEFLPCEGCGCPSESAVSCIVSPDFAAMARCEMCGEPIDVNGKTVVGRGPDGRGRLLVIDLAHARRAIERDDALLQTPANDVVA